MALALAVHGIAIATAACAAAAYGIDASPRLWLSIVPMSIIACAVPISINGWGVRESVMMAFAAMHGLAPAEALLVSLTVGGLNILASLPGAVLLLQRPASA